MNSDINKSGAGKSHYDYTLALILRCLSLVQEIRKRGQPDPDFGFSSTVLLVYRG